MNTNKKDQVVIYTDKHGDIEFLADIKKDTLWTTQNQITKLFGVDQSVVSRHIANIFEDGEIDKNSNMQKMHRTAAHRPPVVYSLDIILAVGYRTNSKKAIAFRKWATSILRQYLINGFNLNKNKLVTREERLENLHKAIDFIESKSDKPLRGKIRVSLVKDLI
jgi:hypothetical protein